MISNHMKAVGVTLSKPCLAMIEEIADALEAIQGERPNRSMVIRLAVITMRKRLGSAHLLDDLREVGAV